MRHILHVIKDPTNRTALDTVIHHARNPELTLSVVLLHDAVRLEDALPGEVFCLDEGPGDAPRRRHPAITHGQLLDLIFAADTVVTW